MKYPNECTRCGFCCLIEPCPAAIYVTRFAPKMLKDGCPFLTFYGDFASCDLAPNIVPVGDGCCIKARAYRQGTEYDFASLSREIKIIAVNQIRKRERSRHEENERSIE